jgi:hypothetical protein
MSSRYTPEPSQINYHADVQPQRVARAKQLIDPGDVLRIFDSRLAQEPDPRAHPLYLSSAKTRSVYDFSVIDQPDGPWILSTSTNELTLDMTCTSPSFGIVRLRPILNLKVRHLFEVSTIACHHNAIKFKGDRSN